MCDHMFGYSQGKASGNCAGWIPESGRADLGIPEETGVSERKVLPARMNLPARKNLPALKRLPAPWQ